MSVRILQVDAFTAEPFRGNPAGVCLLTSAASPTWMQALAAEVNVSETAFVQQARDGYTIRYFTAVCEVPLCGHATLASAHVLWEEGLVSRDARIGFTAPGGSLAAWLDGGWICLDFPSLPVEATDAPARLVEALGAQPTFAGRSSQAGYLLELAEEETVRRLRPDLARLREGRYGGVIATARCAAGPHDFVSRFFAPDMGIDEDPVTGVAHCSLAPYWAAKLGKPALSGHQVSARGGVVRVAVRGDRVELAGHAVTVIRGQVVV